MKTAVRYEGVSFQIPETVWLQLVTLNVLSCDSHLLGLWGEEFKRKEGGRILAIRDFVNQFHVVQFELSC